MRARDLSVRARILAVGCLLAAVATPVRPAGEGIPEIRGYRKWTRVNASPLRLPDPTAKQCRAQLPGASQNPHRRWWFTVYVNERGRAELQTKASPVYPVGTVLVKEKLSQKNSAKPALRTVMVKVEPSFDSDPNDWDYYLEENGKVTQGRQETAHCRSCHNRAEKTDYVFRTYLPQSLKRALR